MHTVAAIAVLAAALASSCAAQRYGAPPRGWDSYDSNPIWAGKSITETEVVAQASSLAQMKAPDGTAGFPYVVIDEGWAEDGEDGWLLDAYARPIVNPLLFPSASGGAGFRPLANKLQAMGLTLGLWMIKGIPKKAVDLNLPIYGTPYTAREIAIPNKACPWHQDVLWVNASHPGGAAYYQSLMSLYLQTWGVRYIKIDCIFGADLDAGEVEIVSRAIFTQGVSPAPVLSLSPGKNATPAMGSTVGRLATAYRITNDVWDCWSWLTPNCTCVGGFAVVNTTRKLVEFAQAGLLAKQGDSIPGPAMSYPDPDMLAFGHINLRSSRRPQFTPSMMRYMFGLWSITQSPIILGGDVTSFGYATRQMLSSPEAFAMHQLAGTPQLLSFTDSSATESESTGVSVWQSNHSLIVGAFFGGVFPFSNNGDVSPSLTFDLRNVSWCYPGTSTDFPYFTVTDVFSGASQVVPHGARLNGTVPFNDAMTVLFVPRQQPAVSSA